MVMSCELDLGIQDVVERCWQELQLMRIYTKRSVIPSKVTESLIIIMPQEAELFIEKVMSPILTRH